MTVRRRALWIAAAAALVAAGAAWAWPTPEHYGLSALRDCLALRGGLVTISPGIASESSATVLVGNDVALLAFGADEREGKDLADGMVAARRYANLAVTPGTVGPSGRGGTRALAAVERCLSDGQGDGMSNLTGYRYPLYAITAFEDSCRTVRASLAQCRCVLTGAQSKLSLDDFRRVTNPATIEEQLIMEDILDGCRLVG